MQISISAESRRLRTPAQHKKTNSKTKTRKILKFHDIFGFLRVPVTSLDDQYLLSFCGLLLFTRL
jgi:hypothetical protein